MCVPCGKYSELIIIPTHQRSVSHLVPSPSTTSPQMHPISLVCPYLEIFEHQIEMLLPRNTFHRSRQLFIIYIFEVYIDILIYIFIYIFLNIFNIYYIYI